jgi:hypothetical protein
MLLSNQGRPKGSLTHLGRHGAQPLSLLRVGLQGCVSGVGDAGHPVAVLVGGGGDGDAAPPHNLQVITPGGGGGRGEWVGE